MTRPLHTPRHRSATLPAGERRPQGRRLVARPLGVWPLARGSPARRRLRSAGCPSLAIDKTRPLRPRAWSGRPVPRSNLERRARPLFHKSPSALFVTLLVHCIWNGGRFPFHRDETKPVPCSILERKTRPLFHYSHSIVAGGLGVMSYTTRFTPATSATMRLEMPPKTS